MRVDSKLVRSAMLLILPLAGSADSPTLGVVFSTASVSISPAETGQRRISLPMLEYAFEMNMRCGRSALPERVSISVADTRQQFDVSEQEDAHELVASFVVPAEQIAPLATDGFCVAGDPESQGSIVIRDVLLSQVSLRCAGESPVTHYMSLPLSVRLVCEPPAEGQGDSSIAR